MSGGTISSTCHGLVTRGSNAVTEVTGGNINVTGEYYAVKTDDGGKSNFSNAYISGLNLIALNKNSSMGKWSIFINCSVSSGTIYNEDASQGTLMWISKITGTGADRGFNVYYYDFTSKASEVSFPTWTDYNGQDDIIWYGANITTADGSRVFTSRVYLSKHNYETGVYIMHVYRDNKFEIGITINVN